MEQLLFGNLGTNEASDTLGGSDFNWPILHQRESIKLGFRPVQVIGGEATEVVRTITGMRLGIGRTDEAPTARDFSLTIKDSGKDFTVAGATFTSVAHGFEDGNRVFLTTTEALSEELREERPYHIVNKTDDTYELSLTEGGPSIVTTDPGAGVHTAQQVTPAISFDADAETMKAALEELAGISEASVELLDRSWLLELNDGFDQVELKAKFNRLRPVSHVRIRATERGGSWIHEIRPQQAQIAFDDDVSFEIHSPPVVSELVAGTTIGEQLVPEKQQVVFDPLYRGIYEIRWKGRKTELLDRDDGPEQWAESIAVLADEDGSFRVTNPQAQVGLVYFEGEMAGVDQPLLEVHPVSGPGGDPYITLNLGAWEAQALLREVEFDDDDQAELTLSFEVDYNDWADEEETLTFIYSANVIVQRNLNSIEDATAFPIDHLRPCDPKEYKPYSSNQITVGHAGRRITFGAQNPTNYAHNLGTPDFIPFVWKRNGDLSGLTYGVDYKIIPNSDNDCDIVLLGDYDPAPGTGTLTLLLIGIGDTSAFENHNHGIAQVELLQEKLDALQAQIDFLYQFVPKGNVSNASATSRGGLDVWEFSPFFHVFPTLEELRFDEIPNTGIIADWLSDPERSQFQSGGFVPAVHDAEVANLSTVFDGADLADAADHQGEVFVADAAAFALIPPEQPQGEIFVPGSGGRRSERAYLGEHLASDGRNWYRVERYHEIAAVTVTATADNSWLTVADNPLAIGNKGQFTTSDTLPAGFAVLTDYYVVGRDGDKIQLSDEADGAAVTPTTAGAGVHTFTVPGKSSYYPTAFEIELAADAVNRRQLALKTTFEINFGVEIAVVPPNFRTRERETRVHYSLAWQFGRFTEDVSPAVTDLNLASVEWEPNFAIEHRIHASRTPKIHNVGLRVSRYESGGEEKIGCVGLISGIEIPGHAPRSADFAWRLVAGKFDTENGVSDPRGLVAISGPFRESPNATRKIEPLGFGRIV